MGQITNDHSVECWLYDTGRMSLKEKSNANLLFFKKESVGKEEEGLKGEEALSNHTSLGIFHSQGKRKGLVLRWFP